MFSRPLIFIFSITALILAGAVWYLQAPSGPAPVGASSEEEGRPTTPGLPVTTASARPNPAASDSAVDWDAKISGIVAANTSDFETARALVELLPSLPPDAQAGAAQKIVKLTSDKNIGLLLPALRNPNLSDDVRKILVGNLMTREESVRLPVLAEIAENPNHPDHDEAVAALQNVLGYDMGQNNDDWNASLQNYFKLKAVKSREDALKLNLMQAQQN